MDYCCEEPSSRECYAVEYCEETCYNPAYYNLNGAWGVALDLEFLYFYSRERLPSYGRKVVTVDDGAGGTADVPKDFYYLDEVLSAFSSVAFGGGVVRVRLDF